MHPSSIKYLRKNGSPTESLISQSWDNFISAQPDIVVKVCDNAAKEICPVWFVQTLQIHWALPDPSTFAGGDAKIRDAFFAVMATIESRVKALLARDLADKSQDQQELSLRDLTAAQ